MDDEKLYQVALKFIHGIGDVNAKQLVSYCGSAKQIFKAPKAKLLKIPGIGKKTVDTIARSYDIEMMDKASGYLRTSWTYGISGGGYNRYRGRITIKYPVVMIPDKVEVKTEAQWLDNVSTGRWLPGYDSIFQRDVYTALSGRLGRTVATE